jgi:hypothetical protein
MKQKRRDMHKPHAPSNNGRLIAKHAKTKVERGKNEFTVKKAAMNRSNIQRKAQQKKIESSTRATSRELLDLTSQRNGNRLPTNGSVPLSGVYVHPFPLSPRGSRARLKV